MKTCIKYFAAIILAVFAFTAPAANPPAYQWAFSSAGTYTSTDVSWCVASANMPPGTSPLVTCAAYKSPTTNVLKWFTCTAPCMITGVNTNGIIPCKTNAFAGYVLDGAPVVIRNTSTDKYTKALIHATGSGHTATYITLTTTVAASAGDMLYFTASTNLFFLPGVNAEKGTNQVTGDLIAGPRDRPLLVEIGGNGGSGGAALGLSISGQYLPQYQRSALGTP